MAAAVRTLGPDPRDEALAALHTLSQMCESSLIDKVPEFDTEVKSLQTTLIEVQKQTVDDTKSSMAMAMAITRFMTQAQALVSYFQRHNARSQLNSADGADFLERFRSLQLDTLEETLKLYQFLDGVK